jgi:hypothetical protein
MFVAALKDLSQQFNLLHLDFKQKLTPQVSF